jgi:hypothetical protein
LERQQDKENLAMVMSEKNVGNRGDGTIPLELHREIREYLGGRIAAETLVAADKIFGIFRDYDTMVSENFIWPKTRKRLDNLAPFLELENKKLQTVLQVYKEKKQMLSLTRL